MKKKEKFPRTNTAAAKRKQVEKLLKLFTDCK